jgi:hypothetical protein
MDFRLSCPLAALGDMYSTFKSLRMPPHPPKCCLFNVPFYQAVAMKYYKAVYDFVASDAVELSVKCGELLCVTEYVEHEGWVKAEVASDTRRRGFVPLSYVKEHTVLPNESIEKYPRRGDANSSK